MNINQEQLLMFQTVMETGSFSAAARKLGKVPSAISMSIANLEIDLNLNLFVSDENLFLLMQQKCCMKKLICF